jgi:hypothetical protein
VGQAVAALIAHVTFWVLLPYGWFWSEIGPRGIAVFLGLWCLGWLGLPYLTGGFDFFSSYVAMLDIALVFVIFKGDLRIR